MKYLSFVPGYVVPPLISLLFVYTFTHLLTPHEYGVYAVVLSVVQLTNAALFSWLQLIVKRFYAEAVEQRWVGRLSMSVYTGYALSAALAIAIFIVFFAVGEPDPALRSAYLFGLGLTLARALGFITKAYRVSGLQGWRYGAMESGESTVGFLAALALVVVFGWQANGLIAGVLVGALIPNLIDLSAISRRLREAQWDSATLRQMFKFGVPFTVGYALDYVLSSSDRLLIQHFMSESAVGIYAVAYTMADRAVSAPFQAIALVTYPLLMRAMATSGATGARDQARANLEILLTVAVPALAGLVVGARQIAGVMIGPEFSEAAATLMPWIAAGVFLSGVRLHYFDQALHLAKRTDITLYAALPPALLNVALNVLLLPRIGLIGAVVATVASYAVALIISVTLMRRFFPLPLALPTLVKVVGAAAVMVIALHVADFSATPLGLAGLVVSGGAIYGALVFAFNIAGLRSRLMHRGA